MNDLFIAAETWQEMYPGAAVGFLLMHGVANPPTCDPLDQRKQALEADLRAQFGGQTRSQLAALPHLAAYAAYYSRFKKTYHVQLQLESVALKGKSIPRVAALVEAMFMAELQNQLLTAGHDWAAIKPPVRIGIGRGDEGYVALGGQPQVVRADDMFMADGDGPISSIIHGPDARTSIRPETRAVLFAVYAPPGVGGDAVRRHLETIRTNVHIVTSDAQVGLLQVLGG